MLKEIIRQRNLQKAVFCGSGVCHAVPERWAGLSDAIIANGQKLLVKRMVKEITDQQSNIFGYPNEERGLWLELIGDERCRNSQKEKADALYFVGCNTSFLINKHHEALAVVNELNQEGIDFALLGSREWCCGIILKRLGLHEEFEACKQHNLKEIQRLGVTQVVFGCHSCYSAWQEEYKPEGVRLVYRESIS